MSDDQQDLDRDGTTDPGLDPPLEDEVTSQVLAGDESGGTPDGGGGSTADETSPGSDGDGVEAGYTTPGELVEDPPPVEPTD